MTLSVYFLIAHMMRHLVVSFPFSRSICSCSFLIPCDAKSTCLDFILSTSLVPSCSPRRYDAMMLPGSCIHTPEFMASLSVLMITLTLPKKRKCLIPADGAVFHA